MEIPPFRFDFDAEQLFRGEKPVPLRPKTWAVLRHLVGRQGFLVTRGELLDAVWQGSAVCDDNLTQSITELRRALGDDARKPRFIETVHGRGFRFLARAAEASALAGAASVTAPPATFVGRAAEIRRMAELFADAERGNRRIVFVTGEPGIGKTSFVQASLAAFGRAPWIGRGQCVEHFGLAEPYMALVEAVQRAVAQTAAAATVTLRRLAPSWAAQIFPGASGERRAESGTTPGQVIRELAVALEALTATRTLVLVLEDLHWSDPSTIDFLSVLGQRTEPARLLVIGTYRPAEAVALDHPVRRAKAALEARGRATEIPLELLAADEVRAYAEVRLGKSGVVGDVARWLYEGSEGNPLFMVALMGHALSGDGGAGMLAPRDVPSGLKAMISAELDRLDVETRAVLEAGAVAGVAFDSRVVAAALGREASEIETICEGVVQRRGLLTRLDAPEWPDGTIGGRYAFRHSLYREVLYDGISPSRRREAHERVGLRLESGQGSRASELASELALHFDRGGDRARAVRHQGEAARRAIARAAYREAGDDLEAAFRNLAAAQDLPERARTELALLQLRAIVIMSEDLFAGARAVPALVRMRDLAAEIGDRSALFEAHRGLWFVHMTKADGRETLAEVHALAKLGAELSPAHATFAQFAAGMVALYGGKPAEGRRFLERVVSAEGTSRGQELGGLHYGVEPIGESACNLAYALWIVGLPDSARTRQEQALARAERCGQPFDLITALVHSAHVRTWRRDFDVAIELSARALALGHEFGITAWRGAALMLNGAARIQRGGGVPALADAREGTRAWLAATGIASVAHTQLATSCLALGEIDEGLASVDEGLAALGSSGEEICAAEIWRLKGELLAARSGERAAEECFERALEIARRQGALAFELRAATSLARHGAAGGEEASSRLRAVLDRFTEGAKTADRLDAESVLARHAVPKAPRRRR